MKKLKEREIKKKRKKQIWGKKSRERLSTELFWYGVQAFGLFYKHVFAFIWLFSKLAH